MKNPIPKFYGLSKSGNVQFERWPDVSRYLTTMDGKRVEIVIKPYKPRRSNPQNRYYHGVIIPILADHFGYTHDEMHDAIKWEFLKKEEDEESEEIKPPTVGSTAKLKTDQFNQLLEEIKQWAASEYKVFIPDPMDVEYS